MEIIIKGNADKDFPNIKNLSNIERWGFYLRMEESIRRRLELRANDTVQFQIDS